MGCFQRRFAERFRQVRRRQVEPGCKFQVLAIDLAAGNTYAPPNTSESPCRSSRKTSIPAAESRSMTTVADADGDAGVPLPMSMGRA
jgi:hypothetical protein